MKIRGTDFIMYEVSDIATAAAFYRDVLGLEQETYSEEHHYAEFACGNVTLALHGGGELPDALTGGRIALAVDDVDAACAELKQTGARVVGEPVDYGVCQAVEVLDPDGNTVLLHHRADGTYGPAAETDDTEATAIIAMEHAAHDRWGRGDPSGYLEISAPDVTNFDNTQERRLDGLEALTPLYEKIRGRIHLDRYEMLEPRVQVCGEVGVLTYNLVAHAGGDTSRWNCTQVYQRTPDGWRIIHTHRSPTKPSEP